MDSKFAQAVIIACLFSVISCGGKLSFGDSGGELVANHDCPKNEYVSKVTIYSIKTGLTYIKGLTMTCTNKKNLKADPFIKEAHKKDKVSCKEGFDALQVGYKSDNSGLGTHSVDGLQFRCKGEDKFEGTKQVGNADVKVCKKNDVVCGVKIWVNPLLKDYRKIIFNCC